MFFWITSSAGRTKTVRSDSASHYYSAFFGWALLKFRDITQPSSDKLYMQDGVLWAAAQPSIRFIPANKLLRTQALLSSSQGSWCRGCARASYGVQRRRTPKQTEGDSSEARSLSHIPVLRDISTSCTKSRARFSSSTPPATWPNVTRPRHRG